MNHALRLFVCIIGLCLFGCAGNSTKKSINYYLIEPIEQAKVVTVTSRDKYVCLLPIDLPQYLKQVRLVMRKSSGELEYANYHFWADLPERSMPNVLLASLNASQQYVYFEPGCSNADSLQSIVEHFYPGENGEVLLSGRFLLLANSRPTVDKPFRLVRDLQKAGYGESVRVMGLLLSDLAKEINMTQ